MAGFKLFLFTRVLAPEERGLRYSRKRSVVRCHCCEFLLEDIIKLQFMSSTV